MFPFSKAPKCQFIDIFILTLSISLLLSVISLTRGMSITTSSEEQNVEKIGQHYSAEESSSELRAEDGDGDSVGGGFAPTHASSPQNQIWGFGDTWKEIICSVKADPVAAFTWSYGEHPVVHSDRLVVTNPQDNFSLLKVKIGKTTLGEYTCRAENDFGASERKINVGQAAMPPIPEFRTVVVSNPHPGIGIHVTGFKVRKSHHPIPISLFDEDRAPNAGETLQVKGYSVQMRKFRTCDPWTTLKMRTEKKFLKRGLTEGTKYRIRIATKTDAGVGEYSRAQMVDFFPVPPVSDVLCNENETED